MMLGSVPVYIVPFESVSTISILIPFSYTISRPLKIALISTSIDSGTWVTPAGTIRVHQLKSHPGDIANVNLIKDKLSNFVHFYPGRNSIPMAIIIPIPPNHPGSNNKSIFQIKNEK
ncbi:uncharacterized protein DS421_11g332910 [Arachis hypogaea]|nr:uncharacterized protein DS421_11g332910 [Arachis hypogaea]